MKKSTATPQTDRPVLRPALLSFYEKRHDIKEIARHIDKRPLGELDAQVTDALQQILIRVHAGNDEALAMYFKIARQAVMSFDNLVRHAQKRTRTVAEHSPNLPILLSLNPKDIEAAKERARLLNVGAKAVLPTRSGQRTDRRNHWTRLAIYAFDACSKNIQLIPQIDLQQASAPKRRVKRKLWDTVEDGTEFTLPDGSRMVVSDWQRECAKLTVPVIADNFDRWQDAIKMCVLEFWKRSKNNYDNALKEVGNSGELESQRRHSAMKRTLQAFKSQFLPR